jgi:heterodisulfide reductase subunit A-like polyferredoxin
VRHGVTILATGAQEYRGPEYGYGQHAGIITQQEFEERLGGPAAESKWLQTLKTVAMIQCVGPAEKTCTRICCTVALKNAVALKERNPAVQVVIFYRDIRTYGFKERLYTAARQRGVIFVRYDAGKPPQVIQTANGSQVHVQAWDAVLQRSLQIEADLLVLSMPVTPNPQAGQLASLFKVPLDADGYFLEAHVKLRPVDFATEGVFMAGMAHYPKLLDESVIQAQAAAARAARVLSQETQLAGGRVAIVDTEKCTGCLTCVRICPFQVPRIQPDLAGIGGVLGAAYIEPAVCQGCGSCAAECPARAIQLMHYTDTQMMAKVTALLQPILAEAGTLGDET